MGNAAARNGNNAADAPNLLSIRRVDRHAICREVNHQDAIRGVARLELVHRAVIENFSVIDQQNSSAEPLDVVQVVRCQDDRRAIGSLDLLDKAADALLRDHIQSDRRLVQVHHAGLVEHRRREVAAHPPSQAELPDRCADELVETEQIDEAIEVATIGRAIHAVHLADQLERLD